MPRPRWSGKTDGLTGTVRLPRDSNEVATGALRFPDGKSADPEGERVPYRGSGQDRGPRTIQTTEERNDEYETGFDSGLVLGTVLLGAASWANAADVVLRAAHNGFQGHPSTMAS